MFAINMSNYFSGQTGMASARSVAWEPEVLWYPWSDGE
jgi:hypothetical protein